MCPVLKGVLGLVLLFAFAKANACAEPVFRYAMRKWETMSYSVLVPMEDLALGKALKSLPQDRFPNAEFSSATQAKTLRVFAPWEQNRDLVMWQESLTPKTLENIIDSPRRRELTKRLMAGEAGVFVLLHQGKAQVLEEQIHSWLKKAEMAAKEYQKAEAQAESVEPKLSEESISEIAAPVPIRFSLLSFEASEANEAFFAANLLAASGVSEKTTDPVLIAVFARGRVLPAISGKELTENTLAEECAFLYGPCSCTVKEQCPGQELLISADWESAAPPEDLPPLTGLGSSVPLSASHSTGATSVVSMTIVAAPMGLLGIGLALVLIVLAVASIFILRRKGDSQ